MEPATIRLPEPMKADLEAEAEERGLTVSSYARRQLKQRDPDADLSRAEGEADTTPGAGHDAVADLTARVERLEAEVGIGDGDPNTADPSGEGEEPTVEDADKPQVPLLDAILGIGDEVLPEHQAVNGVLYYLIATGTATAEDLKQTVYGDYPAEYDDAKTWYTELVSPYLNQIAETGAISEDNGRWRPDPSVTLSDPAPPTA